MVNHLKQNNEIKLITHEHCHKCNSYHDEDLCSDWLKERLVDDKALEE